MNELHKIAIEGSADLIEVGLDTLINNEIVKSIPVLGLAIKVAYSVKSIGDRIFLKKVISFLNGLSHSSINDRLYIVEKIANNEKERTKIGENLILLIDRYNDLEKADLLAKFFSLFLEEKISSDAFLRIGNAIDFAYITDLKAFISNPNKHNVQEGLIRSGLVGLSQTGISTTTAFNEPVVFHPLIITDLGKEFLKIQNYNS